MKNAISRKVNVYNFNSLLLLYVLIPVVSLMILKDLKEQIYSHMQYVVFCV